MLAYHYAKSDNPEKVVQYLKLSGEKAMGHYASKEAYNFYQEAIHTFNRLPDTAQHKASLLEIFGFPLNFYSNFCTYYGVSLAYTGNLEHAKILFKKAYDFNDKINNIVNMATTELFYSIYYLVNASGEKTIEHAQKSCQYFEIINVTWCIGLSHNLMGYGYFLLGDLDTARRETEKGLNIHKESTTIRRLPTYSVYLSMVHYEMGDYEKARQYGEEALALSKIQGVLDKLG